MCGVNHFVADSCVPLFGKSYYFSMYCNSVSDLYLVIPPEENTQCCELWTVARRQIFPQQIAYIILAASYKTSAVSASSLNVVQWSEDLYEKQLIERTLDACKGPVDIVFDFGSTSRSLLRSMKCLAKVIIAYSL